MYKRQTFFGRLEERKGLALFCDALDLLVGMDAPRFTVSFLGKSAMVAGRDAIGYIEERAGHWPFAWQIISDRTQQGALAFLRQGGRLAVIPVSYTHLDVYKRQLLDPAIVTRSHLAPRGQRVIQLA